MAEYAIAPIKTTVKRPEEVSAIDGASLGVAGSTAIELVCDYIGIKLDGSNKTQKNLLITAASGGVGIYAVQVLPPSSTLLFFHSYDFFLDFPNVKPNFIVRRYSSFFNIKDLFSSFNWCPLYLTC